jgi:hypothetical protein
VDTTVIKNELCARCHISVSIHQIGKNSRSTKKKIDTPTPIKEKQAQNDLHALMAAAAAAADDDDNEYSSY